MNLKPVILSVSVALAFGAMTLAARAQSLEELARQGAVKEHEIQSASQKLGVELNAMIDEYRDNGLNGDEIKSLKSLKGILTRLSDKDMEKIIALLRSASESADGKTTLGTIAQAYAQQKSVLVQLKQVLSAYAADQEAIELSENAAALADRQAANLQAGIETAQWSLVGAKPDESAVAASLEAQAAEQNAIIDESRLLQAKIAQFAQKSTDKEVAARFQKGAEEIVKIFPNLGSAAESLGGKKQFEAVGSEKTARDQLRQLARTIIPPRELSELLKDASDALDKLISEQEGALTATEAAEAKPFDAWLAEAYDQYNRYDQRKKGPGKAGALSQLAWHKETAALASLPLDKLSQETAVQRLYTNYVGLRHEPLSGVEDRQGDLANQADLLSQDLDSPAKPVADLVRSAIPPMQQARAACDEKDTPAATASEKNALVALKNAKAALGQELAAAQEADKAKNDAQQGANAAADLSGSPDAGAQKALDAAQQALEALDAIIKAEQNLQVCVKQAGAAATVQALALQQSGIQNDTATFATTITIPDAQQPLTSATTHMDAARGNLAKANSKLAEPGVKQALTDLYAAQKALEAQVQADQQALAATLTQDATDATADAGAPADAPAPAASPAPADAGAAQSGDAALSNAASQADPNAAPAPPGLGTAPGAGPGGGPPMPGPPADSTIGSQGDGGEAHRFSGRARVAKAKFLGLPARDRKAIQQAQAEPYPPQYAASIEQYMKNLSDESSRH